MTTTPKDADDTVLKDFAPVLDAELDSINDARARQSATAAHIGATVGETPYQRAQRMQLAGLAFSGGGIRSATFNLGIIQALCTRGCIGRFDYLSTVSGGGYIGSWLSALIHARAKVTRTAAELQDELGTHGGDGKPVEDRSIGFLRAYSNYLTPRLGLLSTDTLAGVSAYLRNLILVQTTIIALLVLLLMLPRWLYALFWSGLGGFDSINLGGVSARTFALGATAMWSLSVLGIAANMHGKAPRLIRGAGFVWTAILIPGVIGALLWSHALMANTGVWTDHGPSPAPLNWVQWLAIFGAVANGMSALGFRHDVPTRILHALVMVVCGAIGGAVGGAGFELLQQGMLAYGGSIDDASARWLALSIGPIAVLQCMSFGVVFYLGLLGRLLDHETHEWWARYGAYILGLSVGIGAVFAISVYGPVLVEHGRAWVVYGGGPLWLLTSAWGLYKGASAGSKGETATWTERALSIAPYVFIFGLTVALSWATYAFTQASMPAAGDTPARAAPYAHQHCEENLPACQPGTDSHADKRCEKRATPCLAETLERVSHIMGSSDANPVMLLLLSGSAALWLALAWRVDINLFSFHNFYRNRLTRCYLGGARMDAQPPRRPHPFTGFDADDDLSLHALADVDGDGRVCRPFHLLNTALNMSTGNELAWQQRKAGSFFFSPLHCGYALPATAEHRHLAGGFAPTAHYMWTAQALAAREARAAAAQSSAPATPEGNKAAPVNGGAMLGSVMAVSGAAASPNWGFHTAPGVAFVLTMFNIRLGRWCPNPGHPHMPKRPSPLMGGWQLLNELFGATSASAKYVYLSDGGHFDNLGVYELVRRRVSTIVVCDCGQDANMQFDDLADTIRKCYTDFGVDIDIDVEALTGVGDADALKLSKLHCAKGKVHFPPLADGTPAFSGELWLVKPGLSAAICATAPDLRNYALANPEFPQQSTADQWFDEAQFESYRKLGYLVGMSVFENFDKNLP